VSHDAVLTPRDSTAFYTVTYKAKLLSQSYENGTKQNIQNVKNTVVYLKLMTATRRIKNSKTDKY